jgi:hypothetical protein
MISKRSFNAELTARQLVDFIKINVDESDGVYEPLSFALLHLLAPLRSVCAGKKVELSFINVRHLNNALKPFGYKVSPGKATSPELVGFEELLIDIRKLTGNKSLLTVDLGPFRHLNIHLRCQKKLAGSLLRSIEKTPTGSALL